MFNTDTIGRSAHITSVYNKALAGDSLSSSFCILIKTQVKAHKHVSHSEHVLILEGEGTMTLAEKIFAVKKGDLIFIPKNTVHAVKCTSSMPLKVISIQAPLFDGKDRVFVE